MLELDTHAHGRTLRRNIFYSIGRLQLNKLAHYYGYIHPL
jgi:hypothetical protein